MAPEYREKERKSWAERDKMAGRSAHRKEARPDRPPSRRASAALKKRLDAMFTMGEKLSDEQLEALREMQDAPDRDAFVVLADQYIATHGLPSGWNTLGIFLRHREPKVLTEVIERMEKIMTKESEVARGNFAKDLSAIEMTTRDRDLRRLTIRVQAAIRAQAPAK